ncbi:MAG: DoxX family protein [Pseudomonadota bacterium]
MISPAFSESPEVSDAALLLARIGLSSAFLYSGVTKLLDRKAAEKEIQALGVPCPPVGWIATVMVQILGALMLLTGIGLELGALMLAGFTAFATALGHPVWRLEGAPFKRALTTSLEHLGLISSLVLVASIGPGALSF